MRVSTAAFVDELRGCTGCIVLYLNDKNSPAANAGEQLEESTVLVVDDNEQLLDVLVEVLSTEGYRVLTAESGSKALELLEQETPNLIICDVMMPEMDGFALHHEIRKNSKLCDLPFVFLTALSDRDDVRAGREHGCDEYLTKPFDPNDLRAVVKGKLSLAGDRRGRHEEERLQQRRRIIHTLSHEFRTPLVAINTGAELLLEQHGRLEEDKLENLLGSIQRGGLRLQRLVEDFMIVQQIDSGNAQDAAARLKRNWSLRSLIESAIEELEDLDRDTEAHLSLRQDGEFNDEIFVYSNHVVDAIRRIIENAFKFAGKEEQTELLLSRVDDEIILLVRDRGPGMPKSVMDEAQNLFSQINREKLEQQGCGLGLGIAGYFTQINGGSLSFIKPCDDCGLEVVFKFAAAAKA